MVKLLLVHPVSPQGRDNVSYQCVLRGEWRLRAICVASAPPGKLCFPITCTPHLVDLEGQSRASREAHQLLPEKGWVRLEGSG